MTFIASREDTEEFVWTPGIGPDSVLLARMRDRFSMPLEPMGEAWFMSLERRMFPEFLAPDPAEIPLKIIEKALWEIGSGSSSFGLFEEWDEWFHYLFPRLIPRALETGEDTYFGCALSWLVTAFIDLYPEPNSDTPQEVKAFLKDALATLGQAIMEPAVWSEGKLKASPCWPAPWMPTDSPRINWREVSNDFAAAMFFCWRYLNLEQIDAWVQSVLRIECLFWRMELVVWLLGVAPILHDAIDTWDELSDVSDTDENIPYFHLPVCSRYFGDDTRPIRIVSEANREAFRTSLQEHLTASEFLGWVEQFPRYDCLGADLGNLPS